MDGLLRINLSFGGGQHYCPATALGKKHTEIALEILLERTPDLTLAVPLDQLVWRTRFMKRIPERLPVMWEPAATAEPN